MALFFAFAHSQYLKTDILAIGNLLTISDIKKKIFDPNYLYAEGFEEEHKKGRMPDKYKDLMYEDELSALAAYLSTQRNAAVETPRPVFVKSTVEHGFTVYGYVRDGAGKPLPAFTVEAKPLALVVAQREAALLFDLGPESPEGIFNLTGERLLDLRFGQSARGRPRRSIHATLVVLTYELIDGPHCHFVLSRMVGRSLCPGGTAEISALGSSDGE